MFKHGFVAVKCGDGIGIDIGPCVVVTNKHNNIGLLVKTNYDKPFTLIMVQCVGKPVRSADRLLAGKTYALLHDGGKCVFKYVGNNRAYVYDGEGGCLMGVHGRFPYDVYELQVVNHN